MNEFVITVEVVTNFDTLSYEVATIRTTDVQAVIAAAVSFKGLIRVEIRPLKKLFGKIYHRDDIRREFGV